MRKLLLAVLCTSGVALSVNAQNKTLTVADAIFNPKLNPANISNIAWPGNGETAVYALPDKPNELLSIIKNTEPSVLLKVSDLGIESPRLPMLNWVSADEGRFVFKGAYYQFSLKNKKAEELFKIPTDAENPDFKFDKDILAYTKSGNLFITGKGLKETQVSTDGSKNIVYGETVHRSEFGINKGTFFSNTGKYLAFYRMDQSMVTDYPLVNISSYPAKLNNIKYPMAGAKSHHVTVGVYNLASGKTVYLEKSGDPEQYLTNVTWSPDDKTVFIIHVNRDQNRAELASYDAVTGKKKRSLFIKEAKKYIEPQEGPVFLKDDAGKFLLHLEEENSNLVLMDTTGKVLNSALITDGAIIDIAGADSKKQYLILQSNNGLSRHLYLREPKGKTASIKAIGNVNDSAVHDIRLNTTNGLFIDIAQGRNLPRQVNLSSTDGKVNKSLFTATNPIKDYALGNTKLVQLKAADGTVLNGRLITPPNIEAGEKYPVVIYVYGGPHAQMVNSAWLAGSNLWMQMMAQKGYVVFTLDNRGSGNRNLAFEQATHRQLGTIETEDQMVGVNYLKSLPYVNGDKIGVHGWSFGGFMTTTLMTKYPDVFKVGVAGGPVIDWRMYEIMYTERYMDSPEQNKEGYDNANLLTKVKNLKGKLLMIHGTVDDVVVWQHSLEFLKASVDNGVQLDYFVYPEHPHNVMGKDRVHLMTKVTDYFDTFLK